MKNIILLTFISLSIFGCTKEIPCSDLNVQMIFKAFNPSELDTIVLRKYKANDNFQHLIDTINIFYDTTVYLTSHDTTAIFLNGTMQGIKAHYDWQIVIPALNRTVFISDILSEQSTSKCGTIGEPLGCGCINKIYSLKNNNIFIDFSTLNQYFNPYHIYIDK